MVPRRVEIGTVRLVALAFMGRPGRVDRRHRTPGRRGACTYRSFASPDEPSELFCDGDQIFIAQTRSVVGRRIYDADGNLTKRHFREDFKGTFTNPSTGQSVDWVTHATNIHVLAIPGDLASGVTSGAGLSIRVSEPGGGTVLIDAGRLVFDAAAGDIIASAGPHHFDDYFVRGDVDALQPLCDALA